MFKNIALIVLIFTISYSKAQDYVILDESDDNIWASDDPNFISETDKTLSYLCENYHLILDNEQLDCINLKLIPKAIQEQNDHVINKREVDETEGSGNGEIDLITKLPEIQNKTIDEKKDAESKSISATGISNVQKSSINLDEVVKPKADISLNSTGEINQTTKLPEIKTKNITEEKNDVEPKAISVIGLSTTQNPSKTVDEVVKSKIEVSPNATGQIIQTTKLPEVQNKSIKEEKEDVEPKVISVIGLSNPQNQSSNVDEVAKSKTEVSPNANETKTDVQSEAKNIESAFEKAANETVQPKIPTEIRKPNINLTSTEKPGTVAEEKPTFPPLQHKIPDESVATSTTANKTSTAVKEGSNVDITLDADKKEQKKNPPQVLPSDLAEEDQVNKPKESESVNNQQSGNAILLKSPTNDAASSVEGRDSEKVLNGLKENEEIRAEPTEQPSAGESSKNVNKASKDTTVLIVLFVVVLAIGGAAFTHNFIKKRKQRSNLNSNIVNGIRRSLQNLDTNSSKNNTDVEKGTELKPLMKNSPLISNEFTDEKKEEKA